MPKTNNNLLLLELPDDPLRLIAQHIVEKFSTTLPNLTNIIILLPDSGNNNRLRQYLLEASSKFPGLLGPEISTLRNWVTANIPGPEKIATGYLRELILVNALLKYPDLYKASSPWALADNLLHLFDELTLYKIDPFSSEDNFTQALHKAYGVYEESLESLNRESKLVYSLWKSWHEQLAQDNITDSASAWLMAMANTDIISKDIHFYIVGNDNLLPAEKEWIKTLYHKQQLTLALYKNHIPFFDFISTDEEKKNNCILSSAYEYTSDTLINRVKKAKKQFNQSDTIKHISTATLNNAESEAIAVDIQVRQWLLEGKSNIGVITNDRRLGRRVRALLERANISVQDNAGWALSTTRAAAVLERWIQTLEQDFNHIPLLDVLKSSFILPDWDYEKRIELVYHFEQNIIQLKNISGNLDQFRKHINLGGKHLNKTSNVTDELHKLLDVLEQAFTPLAKIIKKPSDTHKATYIIDSLLDSLKSIGIYELLEQDDAGCRLLQELVLMQQSSQQANIRINWLQWREWLGKTLEQYNFIPKSNGCYVQLASLEQTGLTNFDAIIIAGADTRHLPGNPNHTPFFNENVYLQLGLPSRYQLFEQRFFLFRRLLESTPALLITHHEEEKNEILQLCPWVEILNTFHQMVFNKSLHNKELVAMTSNPQAQIFSRENVPLPQYIQRPAVSVPTSILPDTISVTAHQHLIDCPYKFFVRYCLKLSPADEVSEVLEKSDYGSKVHLCLHAFHSNHEKHPGPFPEKITDHNRNDAIKMLEDISFSVFKTDLEDNFEHRGWYNQWRSLIPVYIDWQKQNNIAWSITATEKDYIEPVSSNVKLKGRLDRIDTKENETAVLDYKTGQIASRHDLESGESIQLPSYKLLSGSNTKEVAFLGIETNKISKKNVISDDALDTLACNVNQRLINIFSELHQQQPMPAWSDEQTCDRCEASGVCRIGGWSDK